MDVWTLGYPNVEQSGWITEACWRPTTLNAPDAYYWHVNVQDEHGTYGSRSFDWVLYLATRGKLFVIGGTDGSQAWASVFGFEMRPDGALAPLTAGATLPAARLRAAGALSQQQDLYVIGGQAGDGAQANTVYRALVVSEVFMPLARGQFAPAPTPTSTPTQVSHPPRQPTLLSPPNGSTHTSMPTLCWQDNGDPDGDQVFF